MSILPVYLSSFSSVAPLQRGVSERLGLDRSDRSDSAIGTGQTRKSVRSTDDDLVCSHNRFITRSGDVVSDYGDVFSPSRPERSGESTQNVKSQGVIAEELTDEEKLQVVELKQRDAEVKAHEAAHLGAAGGLARGGASYEYQKGPDGQNYAVGGEVSLDSSPVHGNPEATIAKAQQIRGAALAPTNPSSQDYKVAAQASRIEAEARQELAKNGQETQDTQDSEDSTGVDHAQKSGGLVIKMGHSKSPSLSHTAAMKYVANSQSPTSRPQPGFRGFA